VRRFSPATVAFGRRLRTSRFARIRVDVTNVFNAISRSFLSLLSSSFNKM
jgi:hypothetical protein